jgi:nitrilase
MIIDPWGRILEARESGNGVVAADVDLDKLGEIRKRFPTLAHRRLKA